MRSHELTGVEFNNLQLRLLAIEQGCREVSQLAPVLHAQGITPTAKNLRNIYALSLFIVAG
ncbi:hypothetical protein [Nostoc sp.]|uniref:hypothetical protein n=1 Tax=Nostoc sp. TaxID=1180 RepID=UPI002FF548AD